uniref:Putative prokaryotic JAB domain contining protein n=1 Tax=viral metagenome TaxID=1070528 RepID=A0A6M3KBB0_9ZZZZ
MWGKQQAQEAQITCSLIHNPVVYIESTPRAKIELLMKEYPHQEWLAYLTGRISEKENIFVEDISIPPHKEASGASAEAEPFHTPENCVGFIHSHHTMGAFHSGIDQSHVDKNYPVSITVAKNGGNELVYDGVSYTQTPCGKDTTLKATVKYVQPSPLFDSKKWLTEAKANIDKGRKIYQPKVVGAVYPRHSISKEPLLYSDYTDSFGYTVDGQGFVLTQKELEEMERQIWKD